MPCTREVYIQRFPDCNLVLGTQGEHDHEVNHLLPINKYIEANKARKMDYL